MDRATGRKVLYLNQRQFDMIVPSGHKLAVYLYGQGEPVLLLHGFPLDATIWRHQYQALVDGGFQVIAPDLRGFGQSSEIGNACTMRDFADDVHCVCDLLAPDERVSLVGLSMGGYIAFEFWSRYGNRLNKLVLTNTKPTADSAEAKQARLAMGEKALSDSTWYAVAPMLPRLLSQESLQQNTELTQWLSAMMARVPAATIAHAQKAMADRSDFSERLGRMNHESRINLPVLVITGQLDPISTPEECKQWSAKIPNCNLAVIDNAGHLPQLEQPQSFNQTLLEFLRAH